MTDLVVFVLPYCDCGSSVIGVVIRLMRHSTGGPWQGSFLLRGRCKGVNLCFLLKANKNNAIGDCRSC